MSVVFDLTHTLHSEIPTFGDEKSCCFRTISTVEKNGFFNRDLALQEHVGTHIDAPSHCDRKGVCVDEISPERLTGPLVVLDVAKECRSSDVYAVSDVDILKHEKKHGQIAKKSIVCAYTAWSKRWDDPFRYKNEMRFPGFSLEACQLLVSRGVSAIGIDTLSVDVGTSIDFPVHNFGLKKGLFFLENVAGLDQILANPGSYLCVVGAVKLKGGSGGPCRILAIKSSL